jgi:hypothetical protein
MRHQDHELCCIIGVQEEPIEAIHDVELGWINWAHFGVGMLKQPQDAWEHASKLHDLGGKFHHSVLVDSEPCVVHEHLWVALLPFILDHMRQKAQVLVQTLDLVKREDDPEVCFYEVSHLLMNKFLKEVG